MHAADRQIVEQAIALAEHLLDLGAGGLVELDLPHHVDVEVLAGADAAGEQQTADEGQEGAEEGTGVHGLGPCGLSVGIQEAWASSRLMSAFWAASSTFSSSSRTSMGLMQ